MQQQVGNNYWRTKEFLEDTIDESDYRDEPDGGDILDKLRNKNKRRKE